MPILTTHLRNNTRIDKGTVEESTTQKWLDAPIHTRIPAIS